jgi:phage terminase large subunit
MFNCGPLYQANLEATEFVVINQGGTSSSKTYSINQVLFTKAIEERCVITVVADSIPNLKGGALRDALTIEASSPFLQSQITSYNKSDRTFTFKSGAIMEFKSYEDEKSARSGKRDYLFVNEANAISWDIYFQLALRTRKRVFIDYNPSARFWAHEQLIGKEGVKFLRSWHEHNPFLSQNDRDKIEAIKDIDEELWQVYGRGKTGKITGLVYTNWALCDKIPDGAKLIAKGKDFGFTNDPTTLIDVYMQNGELWVDELLYETGLTNQDIGVALGELGVRKGEEIVADSAEPKSIAELRAMGWNVQPAKKGPDSIRLGIGVVKQYKLNITRRSKNIRAEILAYKWKVDRITGKTLREPIDGYNHTLDPIRYVALNKLALRNVQGSKKLY